MPNDIPDPPRLCVRCGQPIPRQRFIRHNPDQIKFCSTECRQRPRESVLVGPGTSGAISEYIVVADLLRRGYDVFRAASPYCSCDLVLLLDTGIKRIEVRTGYFSPQHGTIGANLGEKDRGRFDILAVVYEGGRKVAYAPNWIGDTTEHPPLGATLKQRLTALGIT